MKKKALLILGLALMIAAAGVVYAHWTDSLKVHATINTGSVCVDWTGIFTDDDGGNSIGEETNLPNPVFGQGSVDPRDFAVVNRDGSLVSAAPRYDKAIGGCYSGISSGQGEYPNNLPAGTMWVNISNTYPSYHCTIWSTFTNCGTVPVKVQSVETSITGDLNPETDAYWHTLYGTGCGLQIDPGKTFTTVNQFHLLQPAPMGKTAYMTQSINFVNWNEWNANLCGDLPLEGTS